jgi:hypothetical protein
VKFLNKKYLSSLGFALVLVSLIALTVPLVSAAKPRGLPRGSIVVYVTSTGKYYDTIVPIDPEAGKQLPWKGRFQLLEMAGPTGLQTEFGPGDQEYVGGRWWLDVGNDPGEQDANDVFFLCPLLGPGRDAP